jgi:hypothetical protein
MIKLAKFISIDFHNSGIQEKTTTREIMKKEAAEFQESVSVF